MHTSNSRFIGPAIALCGLALLAGCGGGSGSSDSNASGGGGTSSYQANQVPVRVNGGPQGINAVNVLYTSVTICVHGSTTKCQTIDNVQVDTASSGLRVLNSVLGHGVNAADMTQVLGSNGNSLLECTQFADGYSWGPIRQADIMMGGEVASNVNIQILADPAYPASLAPASCTGNVNVEEDTVADLGANGILGIQGLAQDCGSGCPANGSVYNDCTSSTCVPDDAPLDMQVTNPVFLFAADNNGVSITLPAVSGDKPRLVGTMTFGIGTETDNALVNTASIYTVDDSEGAFTANFAAQTLPDSIIDTGSSAYFFPDGEIPICKDLASFYCPAATLSLSSTITGQNGQSTIINFEIGNASKLDADIKANASMVVPTLGGTIANLPTTFDFGLAFFYGRTVYIGNEDASIGGQVGPLIAF